MTPWLRPRRPRRVQGRSPGRVCVTLEWSAQRRSDTCGPSRARRAQSSTHGALARGEHADGQAGKPSGKPQAPLRPQSPARRQGWDGVGQCVRWRRWRRWLGPVTGGTLPSRPRGIIPTESTVRADGMHVAPRGAACGRLAGVHGLAENADPRQSRSSSLWGVGMMGPRSHAANGFRGRQNRADRDHDGAGLWQKPRRRMTGVCSCHRDGHAPFSAAAESTLRPASKGCVRDAVAWRSVAAGKVIAVLSRRHGRRHREGGVSRRPANRSAAV